MPRFSANLGFLWTTLSLVERIARAADAGFEAVEFHWPYDTPPETVREACVRHGLALVGLNTAVGNAEAGDFGLAAVPGRERAFRQSAEQAIAYCRACGARAIHVMAGNVTPERPAAAGAVFRENLRWMAPLAADEGLTLLLEPINRSDKPDYFLSTLKQAVSIIDDVGSGSIRLMFDVYHVARQEGDVLVKLGRYADRIGHVQIAGVPSRAEPDEGEICYRAVFARLEHIGYPGFVGCEYRPRTTVEAGLGWMGRIRDGIACRDHEL